jgi:hypothetical protein
MPMGRPLAWLPVSAHGGLLHRAQTACNTAPMPTREPTAAAWSEADITPEFLAAWRLAQIDSPHPDLRSDPAWTSAVAEVHPGVFTVRLLRPEACTRLLEQIDTARERELERGASLPPPNSMHRHGVLLGMLGFDPLLADLTTRWIRPIAGQVLPQFNGATLTSHHGYLVEYARDKDERLGFHVDDSDVTFNLCLSDGFEGAELTMLGLRCDLHRHTELLPGERYEYRHEPGVAVLHAGRHRHRVEGLRSGVRRNLILWCRDATPSAVATSAHACQPWCAWSSQTGTSG